ncbi:MAG: NAD-dependent succinate-semialdehyde dehydrogenase [Candidatus Neptunochlamydia sp.]|nr:NAD-dependent succinate-semialdehyde dehydrogenase [Candidatus Neptunochlamydia sp.]
MLKDKSLLKTDSYIYGKWVKGKKTFPVKNPFDGKKIADVSEIDGKTAAKAIEEAHKAFEIWKNVSTRERGALLKKWDALMNEHWEDLATLLTLEQGKPYEQSTHELMGNNGFFNWHAEEARRIAGLTVTSPDPNRRFMIWKQPVGVVAIVTPWNFPSVLPVQKCAPALAAGCTVVMKPAEDTPLSALVLAELADRAGIPPGVFNVLTCNDPTEVGYEFTHHPLVRKFTFTGSTEVGKSLYSACSNTIKNITMELGGNCPAVIFEDADIDKAVEGTFGFKFYNAGQCCNNINRFLIHKSVRDQFVEKFKKRIEENITLGNGLDKKTTVGPLINKAAIAKCEKLVDDASSKGATAIIGGARSTVGELFYEPTLLIDMDPNMQMYREEVFGPVAPIYTFSTEEEAIQMANDTNYGLAAYLFSEDIGRTWRVGEAFEAGSVGINTTDVVSELLPFGGWKESGLGRENGVVGSLDAYLEKKSLIISDIQK